ncbi:MULTISPECIES: transporter substrate-binding domain-containing protein [unclassified Bartonella]|uniref:transporter substrate-binding domain-containing protein n=1 Tax=unclassified Bartonella TaxID=2645622 RepID=UPI0021C99D72|nr:MULTISPECIES: transporter substrate-binding domain-containing protein [unclassified Bartonella]UXN02246.1 transporter substrate-binding domain-containing protein [Bartonella sp. HY406]UXN05144.1 transporter substrate-binding domain-containing protein [Bartonella sp. HY761]
MKKALIAFAATTLLGLSTAAQAQTADTLEKLKQTGEVTLGVRESSGLAYTLGNGKYVGFHTEMAERIIDDISKKIGKPLKINYLPITSANRIPLVQNGTYDFECGSTTNNRSRADEASFAYTTYVEEVRIAVKKDSGINSINDLNGKTVATTTGTTSVQTLRRNQRAENIRFKEMQGKDHANSFLLLESDRADAFVMDGSILAANISKAKNPADFKILDEVLSVEPIACMLRKGDDNLKKEIDESIVRQITDGSLEKLYNKWFLEPIPPANVIVNLPLSASTRNAWEHPNDKPMEDYPENK